MYTLEEAKARLKYLKEERNEHRTKLDDEISKLVDFITHEEEVRRFELSQKYVGKYYKYRKRREYFKVLYVSTGYFELIDVDWDNICEEDSIHVPFIGVSFEETSFLSRDFDEKCEEISKDEFLKQYYKATEQVKQYL